MITRLSRFFGKTLRQAPAEAESASHQLVLRARLAEQVASGIYAYLPLGWIVIRRIEQIIREEMDSEGGQEIMLPMLTPVELWQASGRRETLDDILLVTKDRRGRELVLGPTHEETFTELMRRQLQSYRDLPMRIYQIQTKFRDEPRPRGGLIRLRQFIMKDLYSFDIDEAGLAESYAAMDRAYRRIFERCGVPVAGVEAHSGSMGGAVSQEFMLLTSIGEDTVITCDGCGYAANAERAGIRRDPPSAASPLPLEEVATPGQHTIDDLARFLDIGPEATLKAVFYAADGAPVFVAIRGDLAVNETKLATELGARQLRPMTADEVRAAGLVAGSASPVGIANMRVVADISATTSPNLVAGANKPGVHLRHVNHERDWRADVVADIALAREGDPCSRCDARLGEHRAIEMGHIFQLGTKYSEVLGALFLDAEGQQRPAVMGSYGIGVERLLAGVIEANHDERGILWPRELAPYDVHIAALNLDKPGIAEAAERLAGDLAGAGMRVLLDDRTESPGVKFNDADLLGMPLRATVSPRNLDQGVVELRARRATESRLVPIAEAVAACRAELDAAL